MVLESEACRSGSACDPSTMEGRNSYWRENLVDVVKINNLSVFILIVVVGGKAGRTSY